MLLKSTDLKRQKRVVCRQRGCVPLCCEGYPIFWRYRLHRCCRRVDVIASEWFRQTVRTPAQVTVNLLRIISADPNIFNG